ncbi:HAD family hydrolase [Phormidium tenue FACHB-886]|nr:HAD family hydrolase [Phormidium tenue FACHB-886]
MEMTPTLLALDFDGVICDGLIEYFQTAWKTYCLIGSPMSETPPLGLAEQFYRLRPVIETGWEMPVLVQSLLDGIPEAELFSNWAAIALKEVEKLNLSPAEIAARLDGVRDEWIATDVNDWLAQHRFYPGVAERLQQIVDGSVTPFIITTKEQRFVRQLLKQQQVDIAESQIFGKEVKQPKAQTLRSLINRYTQELGAPPTVWFIEDRLKTLQAIETQPDLQGVKLFLAGWGYNTETDRAIAQQDPQIHLLSLSQFAEALPSWV